MSPPAAMKVEHFESFVQESAEVFRKMLGIHLRERAPEVKRTTEATFAISALVGISGTYTGGFVVSAPLDTAVQIVSRMLGETVDADSRDVADGMGELVNIVAGNACRRLGDLGLLSLSVPTLILGTHQVVWRSQDLPCLMMKFFESELGPFSIELNFRASS